VRVALNAARVGRRAFTCGAASMIAACRGPATKAPSAPVVAEAIYDATGEPSTLAAFADACEGADFVAFGELHEHPVASRLERELLEAMLAQPRPVALAMEFFETDHQPAIDAYFAGEIDEATFRARTGRNDAYDDSHRPLVERCKAKGAKVIAANAPRSLVSAYRKSGLVYADWRASLSDADRALVPPTSVPPHDEHERRFLAFMGPERGPAFFKSMALWNDAMAEAVVRARQADANVRVLLVVGAFHVAGKLGVVTCVHDRDPTASTRVLTMRNGGAAWRDADRGEGDLVVCVA
jgi:uncharacterized iron-regulated protein